MSVLLFFLTALLAAAPPFSHKTHAPLKLKCVQCHAGAEKQERATFPSLDNCRVCHPSMERRVIPSQRLYKVPDFVVFSHNRHAAAKLECATCHGEVYQQAELKVERPTHMKACMDCHKEHKANNTCTACHELGQ
jgi:hypothetical protein